MLSTSKGSGCSPLVAAQTSLDPFRTLVRAMLRRPGDYRTHGLFVYLCACVFVCMCFVCVSVSACVPLTSYAYFYVSV